MTGKAKGSSALQAEPNRNEGHDSAINICLLPHMLLKHRLHFLEALCEPYNKLNYLMPLS